MILYPFALIESDDLLSIEKVKQENRRLHYYRCPNCGGEMVPRLGEKNAHCFAHKSGKTCDGESYIHKTAKIILADRFNKSDSFIIGLTSERPCNKASTCKEKNDNCHGYPKYNEYNLLSFYKRPALIEKDILMPDNQSFFRPDVLLKSDNTNRQDIFIEIFHKHRVGDKKILNNRIIEFDVKTMEDLISLEKVEVFKESESIHFYNFKDLPISPDDIVKENRGKHEWLLPPCKQSCDYKRSISPLRRIIVYKSGKTYETGIFVSELSIHNPRAIMEIAYDTTKVVVFNPLLLLAKKDKRIRFCGYCEHYVNWEGEREWCNIGKNGTSIKGTFRKTKGVNCFYFQWSSFFEYYAQDQCVREGEDYWIWINDAIK